MNLRRNRRWVLLEIEFVNVRQNPEAERSQLKKVFAAVESVMNGMKLMNVF